MWQQGTCVQQPKILLILSKKNSKSRMRFLRNSFRTRPQRSGPCPRTEPTPACGHPSGGGDCEDEDD